MFKILQIYFVSIYKIDMYFLEFCIDVLKFMYLYYYILFFILQKIMEEYVFECYDFIVIFLFIYIVYRFRNIMYKRVVFVFDR